MKSFGVRLAAGAVTILFGAYAAALAQKDRQDESDSWTAEAPSIAGPASPIENIGDDSWLKQPATGLDNESTAASVPYDAFQPPGSIQQVQHSESVDDHESPAVTSFGGTLPASLEVDEDSAHGGTASDEHASNGDWLLPEQGEIAPDTSDVPAMAMTFPDAAAPFAETQPGAELGSPASFGVENPDGAPAADIRAAEFYPAEQLHVDGRSLEVASQEPSFDDGPSVVGGGAAIGMAAAGAAAAPTNLLRGSPEGMNALRADDEEFAGDENEIAFSAEDPQVASSPNQFADSNPHMESNRGLQGAATLEEINFGTNGPQFDPQAAAGLAPGGATAGLGTPQPVNAQDANLGAQSNDPGLYAQNNEEYAQPFQAQGSDRMASLPRNSNTTYDGLRNGYQPSAMAQPNSAIAIDPSITLDSPGERRLEGAQTPSIVIQKRAPAEVKVGKPASFVVHVQNVGSVEALNVEVHDRIPAGMRLVDASPSPIQHENILMWELGAMPAGDERTITMQLIPEQEGELGSVARVSFEAAASVRTISTRPELKIVQRVPERGVLIGQQLEIELEVSNPGSGAATGVILQEDVPDGLEHPKGRQLDNALGTLAPGEVRHQVLRLRAVSPGVIQNTIRLMGDDGLTAEHTVSVQVVAPDLQVELSGPSKRFLERQATYQLNVANQGTADATNVEIAVQLDRGFTFVSTDYEGQYDPSRHAVYWSLAQLPAGAKGTVPLTLLPVEAGEQAIKIEARADLGVLVKSERTMSVEGFAELSFAISNPGGPIEIGAETTYEIVVTNSGSKPDTNVRVQLQLPQGLELISADGEAGHDGRGLVAFQPKSQLAPGDELKHALRVRGVAAGTHIVRAVVVSDQSTVPVTKEESTRVYADQ